MKTFLILPLILIVAIFSQAQVNSFENGIPTGCSTTTMAVSNNDVICGAKSLHSIHCFNAGATYSFTTNYAQMSGIIDISFAYYIQMNNSHKNWTMKVQLYSNISSIPVYSYIYTSQGNISNPGCGSINFNKSTTSMPYGYYKLYIEFTTLSTDDDENNKLVIDNVQQYSTSSLPVTFVGMPSIQRIDDIYIKVSFSVADQSSISVYNIQFSEDEGKTWENVAIVIPDNAVLGKTYTVNIKLPKTK